MARVEAQVSKSSGEKGPLSLFGKDGVTTPVEYEQLVERSYSRWIQLALSAACTAIGILWLLGSLWADCGDSGSKRVSIAAGPASRRETMPSTAFPFCRFQS